MWTAPARYRRKGWPEHLGLGPPRTPKGDELKERACVREGCSQPFTPIKPNHVYCSPKCQQRQNKVRASRCSDDNCDEPGFARGYCQRHYGQRRRAGTLPALVFERKCVICEEPFSAKAYQKITCSKECLKARREQTKAERMRTRGCARCGQPFEVTWKGGGSYCPDCQRDWARERRQADPEKAKLDGRKQNLWVKYRMTLDDYNALLDAQGGVCAICRSDDGDTALSVDHDHACCPGDRSCGQCIRGLLCGNCNNGLGRFGDDARRLRAAAAYLDRTRQTTLFVAA